jgi:8-oxo-dGTP pyrophosphatase MutT (NUDIX family)
MANLILNPEQMPIEAIAGEAPVALDQLHVSALRTRFSNPPVWTLEPCDQHLKSHDTVTFISASVLLPIVLREQGLTMLFTQRAAALSNHGGQVCFPGGRVETFDQSAADTALRETEEEVGLKRQHIEVIGTLPEYVTVTGYRVTPVIGLVQPPFSVQADAREVAGVFEVPLAFLMNGMHHQRRQTPPIDGQNSRRFYAIPYEDHFIWGATAAILRNLYHFLRA